MARLTVGLVGEAQRGGRDGRTWSGGAWGVNGVGTGLRRAMGSTWPSAGQGYAEWKEGKPPHRDALRNLLFISYSAQPMDALLVIAGIAWDHSPLILLRLCISQKCWLADAFSFRNLPLSACLWDVSDPTTEVLIRSFIHHVFITDATVTGQLPFRQ